MLFGPGNSILILNDFLTDAATDVFETNLMEAKKYYEAVLLSELVEKQKKGKAKGLFSICFQHARKNFQLKALPVIQHLNLPCTVFIQPECVGTNRLPLQEEMDWLRQEYPQQLTEKQFREWELLILQNQQLAEEQISRLRKELGALPIQKIGPEYFYLKWGALLELEPTRFEFGLHLSSYDEEWIKESKRFAESQLGKSVKTAYTRQELPFSDDKLQQLGFEGLVTECVGAITREKSRFKLPQWVF